jgi:hypothetical protein
MPKTWHEIYSEIFPAIDHDGILIMIHVDIIQTLAKYLRHVVGGAEPFSGSRILWVYFKS